VAGRFPVLTDACVNDHFVRALRDRGWDVVRAIDPYPERTKDEVLFERAAADDRVFVTNDRPAEAIAIRWLLAGRRTSPSLSLWDPGFDQHSMLT
jgi:predicted nuclease of predicted toxin-antitoxin system